MSRQKKKPGTLKNQRSWLFLCTEDKGFEPSHRLTGLTHFECAPFDHLGNPPLLHSTAYYTVRGR